MTYTFALEDGRATYPELQALYRQHYADMQERLAAQGVHLPPCNPQLRRYFEASEKGHLLTYVVRTDASEAVGYSNIYLSTDMHNGDLIAVEDTIYVRKNHRNGVGRRLSKVILADLKRRGVVRLNVTALTDLRVAKLWKRMGFREIGTAMTYEFSKDV